MKARYTERFQKSFSAAPERIQNAFEKQLGFLLTNLRHPSLDAKKYNAKEGIWQARVNRDWRFYFLIEDDTYALLDIMAHPK